jgi:hypothetical protein
MRYRTLGTSGLRVSDLILGAMTFGEQGGAGAPLPECRQLLDLYWVHMWDRSCFVALRVGGKAWVSARGRVVSRRP